MASGPYQESVAAVSVAPRLPHARMLVQDDARPELLSSLLHEDCKRRCVPQQLSARPLSGRGRRYSGSGRLVPMLPHEMMMCEVEAPCKPNLVGSHLEHRVCAEPGSVTASFAKSTGALFTDTSLSMGNQSGALAMAGPLCSKLIYV